MMEADRILNLEETVQQMSMYIEDLEAQHDEEFERLESWLTGLTKLLGCSITIGVLFMLWMALAWKGNL